MVEVNIFRGPAEANPSTDSSITFRLEFSEMIDNDGSLAVSDFASDTTNDIGVGDFFGSSTLTRIDGDTYDLTVNNVSDGEGGNGTLGLDLNEGAAVNIGGISESIQQFTNSADEIFAVGSFEFVDVAFTRRQLSPTNSSVAEWDILFAEEIDADADDLEAITLINETGTINRNIIGLLGPFDAGRTQFEYRFKNVNGDGTLGITFDDLPIRVGSGEFTELKLPNITTPGELTYAIDNTAPSFVSSSVTDTSIVRTDGGVEVFVTYDEPIDISGVSDATLGFVDAGGSPSSDAAALFPNLPEFITTLDPNTLHFRFGVEDPKVFNNFQYRFTAEGVTDLVGNAAPLATTTQLSTYLFTPLSVTGVVSSIEGPTNSSAVMFNFVFDDFEEVENFDSSDLLAVISGLSGGAVGEPMEIERITEEDGSEFEYRVLVSGLSGDGTVSLALAPGEDITFADFEPINLSLDTEFGVTQVDTIPPQLIAATANVSPTNSDVITYELTFDSPVDAFLSAFQLEFDSFEDMEGPEVFSASDFDTDISTDDSRTVVTVEFRDGFGEIPLSDVGTAVELTDDLIEEFDGTVVLRFKSGEGGIPIVDDADNSLDEDIPDLPVITFDNTDPNWIALDRQAPMEEMVRDVTQVTFRLCFDETVTNVDGSDFVPLIDGFPPEGGFSITNVVEVVGGEGIKFDVTVGGPGFDGFAGMIGLGFKGGESTFITDLAGNEVNDASFGTTYSVDNANTDPVAVNDAYVLGEDMTLPVAAPGVLENDSDADEDMLTASLVTPTSNGSVTLSPDGSFNYTPSPDFNGSDSFVYEVSDGNGGTDQATVTLTVEEGNDAPTAVDDTGFTNAAGVATGNVLANDTDPEGDTLSAIPGVQPTNGMVVLAADGSYTYTADPGFAGTDSFTYTASDGRGGSSNASVTITVDPTNLPPAAVDDSVLAGLDGMASGNVLANDTDPDMDMLTAMLVSGPANGMLLLGADGAFGYTATPGFSGADSFTYQAADGNGGVDMATVTITVPERNTPPVAGNDAFAGESGATISGNLFLNDIDLDGDSLTVTANTPASMGAVSVNANGTFTYVSTAGFVGTDSFTYTVSDGNGGSDTATVTLTVEAPDAAGNTPPVAVDDAFSASQDTDIAGDVLTNDTDADGDSLTASPLTGPANGSLTLNPDGSFTYTPDAGFFGADSFTYAANDGNGGSDTATVALTVTEVDEPNEPPVAVDDMVTTLEDTPVDGNVLSNDTDPEMDALSAMGGDGVSNGTVTLTPDGRFTYTPAPDFFGADSFTYSANDGNGNSATGTVSVTVEAANDPPVANDDGATTDEGTPVTIPVLANDTDVDGDTLSIAGLPATSVLGAGLGVVGGGVSYTPGSLFSGLAAGETATDSFTYMADDGNGGMAPATVTVTIRGTTNLPLLGPDSAGLLDGDTVAFLNVLDNDTDPDGDPVMVVGALRRTGVSATGYTLPPGLAPSALSTATMDGAGNVSYTRSGLYPMLPDGATLTETFEYDATDGSTDAMGNPILVSQTVSITGYGGGINDDLIGLGSALTGRGDNDGIDISSGEFDDMFDGGPGNDQIGGGFGNDSLIGGPGRDTILGEDGEDTITGGDDDDVLDGGNDGDIIEGGAGNDKLTGGNGNDTIDGQAGSDVLIGNAGTGNDGIVAGPGNDTIVAGPGTDGLSGGAGSDTFVFMPNEGVNTITDFAAGQDVIGLIGFASPGSFAPQGGDLVLTDEGTTIILVGEAGTTLGPGDIVDML